MADACAFPEHAGEVNVAGAVRLAKVINGKAPLNKRWLTNLAGALP